MYRIDADDFVILNIKCGDHLHRYAVRSYYTIGMVADKVWDTFNPKKRGRRTFTLESVDFKPPKGSLVKVFYERCHVEVVEVLNET